MLIYRETLEDEYSGYLYCFFRDFHFDSVYAILYIIQGSFLLIFGDRYYTFLVDTEAFLSSRR